MIADLPDDPSQLTPEQARKAEAGPEADWLVAKVIGWTVNTVGDYCDYAYFMPPNVEDESARETIRMNRSRGVGLGYQDFLEVLPNALRFSRTPYAAHRAREWLREQGFGLRCGESQKYGVYWRAYDPKHIMHSLAGASGPDEHLATARLLLVMAAEGVLESDPDSEPTLRVH